MQICWRYNFKNSTLNFWNCYFPFFLNPFRLMKCIWKNLEDEMLQVWKIKCDSNWWISIQGGILFHFTLCQMFLVAEAFYGEQHLSFCKWQMMFFILKKKHLVFFLLGNIYITRVCTVTLNAGMKTNFDFSQSILSFPLFCICTNCMFSKGSWTHAINPSSESDLYLIEHLIQDGISILFLFGISSDSFSDLLGLYHSRERIYIILILLDLKLSQTLLRTIIILFWCHF